jgi:hypothetical protein
VCLLVHSCQALPWIAPHHLSFRSVYSDPLHRMQVHLRASCIYLKRVRKLGCGWLFFPCNVSGEELTTCPTAVVYFLETPHLHGSNTYFWSHYSLGPKPSLGAMNSSSCLLKLYMEGVDHCALKWTMAALYRLPYEPGGEPNKASHKVEPTPLPSVK